MVARRKRGELADAVVAYHAGHRHATATDIAQALNCGAPYVRATASRRGIVLSKGKGGPKSHG